MSRKITGAALYGYDDAPTSESGVGLFPMPGFGVVGVPAPAPGTAAIPPMTTNGRSASAGSRLVQFLRSSDGGLLMFGIALLYFDFRLINR